MLLIDRHIRELCLPGLPHPMLAPFSEGVQGDNVISWGLTSAGYDLRLGHKVLVLKDTYCETMDPKRFKTDKGYNYRVFDSIDGLKDHEAVLVPPHGYILAYSLERIHIPPNLKGRCVGKSTLARCGLVVNTTPLEPNWKGHLTIEIANVSPLPVRIYVAEGIAQLEIETLTGFPEIDYASKGGKYDNQGPEPVPARTKE